MPKKSLCVLLLAAVFGLSGCENIDESKYEQVKSESGKKLYRVQTFCPGKTFTYLTLSGDSVVGNCGNGKCTSFDDYVTGAHIRTTCPSIIHPVLRKKVDSRKVDREQMEKIYHYELEQLESNTSRVPTSDGREISVNHQDGSNFDASDEQKKSGQSALTNSIIINNTVTK